MPYYTRTYNPQPTARVTSQELKNEFQAIDNALDAVEADVGKGIRAPEATTVLPNAASRALKVLSFDASGNPAVPIAVVDLTAAVASAAAAAISESNAATSASNASASAASAAAVLDAVEDAAVNAVAVEAAKNTAVASAAAAVISETNAAASADAAAISEANALLSANAAASVAPVFVSGQTVAVGDVRFSPNSFESYRAKTAGAHTTDPSEDDANWHPLGSAQTQSAALLWAFALN